MWGLGREMTKVVCCEEAILGRCDIMYEPSGVGRSEGGAVVYSAEMKLVDVR